MIKKIMTIALAVAIPVLAFAASTDLFSTGPSDEFRVTSDGSVISAGSITAEGGNVALTDGYVTIGTNAAPASSVAATGAVTAATDVALKHGESVTVNDQTYMFSTGTLAAANQVALSFTTAADGHTNSVAFTNLFLAITVGGTNNPTLYHNTTVKPANLTAEKVNESEIKFTTDAGYHGALGNAFVLTRAGAAVADGTNLTVTGAGTFTGGTDGTAGAKGTIRVHGTGISFTTIDSVAGNAVWTTK